MQLLLMKSAVNADLKMFVSADVEHSVGMLPSYFLTACNTMFGLTRALLRFRLRRRRSDSILCAQVMSLSANGDVLSRRRCV